MSVTFGGLASGIDSASIIEAIRDKEAQAHERRRRLLIHREALGFRLNDVLDALYPIPSLEDGDP